MDHSVSTAQLEVFVNERKVPFPARRVTAAQIKATAGIRSDHSLYLRRAGGNEPFRDSETLWLEADARFFTRPPSSISCLDDHR
jgi:multiubiquitin